MSQESNQIGKLDWITVGLYALFVLLGWMSIYSAVYNPEAPLWIFDEAFYTSNAGRQLIWIGTSLVLIMFIFALDFRFFESFAVFIYAAFMLALIAVPFLGVTINGSHSWFKLGGITIQPAEFAKTATALLLAKYLNDPQVNLSKWMNQWRSALIIALPMLLIIGSNETGSALVFASFITSGVTSIKTMGFGVALAVILDATIVRGLLVPALMRLFGERNWWAPKWMQRFTLHH